MEEEFFAFYAWWAQFLILKMMIFIWCTGRLRVSRKVIHSEEDRMFMKEPGVILDPTGGGHPDINRIREAHRSDVETVVPFLLIVLIWLETSPSMFTAKLILRSFSAARIIHGFIYIDLIHTHKFFDIFISLFTYLVITYVAVSCIVRCV